MLNPFLDKFIYTSTLKYTHNNFYLAEVPFVLVPTDLLIGICGEEKADFDKMIYYSTKKSVLKRMLKQFDLHFGIQGEKFLYLLDDFFTASGWGEIKIINIDKKNSKALIAVSSSPIATALKGKVKNPVDHMLRAVFSAMFTHYFKTPVECVENKCFAKGDKDCEFVVKKVSEFNFSNKITRRQLKI